MSIPVPALAAALLSTVIIFRAVRHPPRPALRALRLARVPSSQRMAFLHSVNR